MNSNKELKTEAVKEAEMAIKEVMSNNRARIEWLEKEGMKVEKVREEIGIREITGQVEIARYVQKEEKVVTDDTIEMIDIGMKGLTEEVLIEIDSTKENLAMIDTKGLETDQIDLTMRVEDTDADCLSY